MSSRARGVPRDMLGDAPCARADDEEKPKPLVKGPRAFTRPLYTATF